MTLRPKITPEGDLGPVRREAQQERIENAGERLLGDLQGTQVENVEQFEAVPIVTLEATPEAIEEIARLTGRRVGDRGRAAAAADAARGVCAVQGAERPWGEGDVFWHLAMSEIETAWDNGFDGRGQTVAVLDTGVESNHPWLADKVVDEACFSYARSCPGGLDTATGQGSAQPCTYAESCGHGTHVSHDAAGKYGVARAANIIAVQVFSQVNEGCAEWEGTVCARSYISDQLKGLQHVYDLRDTRRIAAVNLSLGGGQFADYCDALNPTYSGLIKTLVSYGIPVVIATGNDGFVDGIGEPALLPGRDGRGRDDARLGGRRGRRRLLEPGAAHLQRARARLVHLLRLVGRYGDLRRRHVVRDAADRRHLRDAAAAEPAGVGVVHARQHRHLGRSPERRRGTALPAQRLARGERVEGRVLALRWMRSPLVLALAIAGGGCGGGGEERETTEQSDAHWSELERKAAENGVVPIIVTLELDFVPEGELPPADREEQQRRIAEQQQALLGELAGTRVENVTTFTPVPQITMSVGVDAIGVLRESSRVEAAVEDIPLPPG